MDGTSRKEGTKRALVKALELELLSTDRLTVERIAARARANKALVYRYFGGLAGLIRAFAEGDAFLPKAADLLAGVPAGGLGDDPRRRFSALIGAYVRELARRPSSVQILLRAHLFGPEVFEAIREGRAGAIVEIREAFGDPGEAPPFDLDLAFNLLISGACQLLGQRPGDRPPGEDRLLALGERIATAVGGMLSPADRG